MRWAALTVALFTCSITSAAPPTAEQYRRALTREARAVWGLDAPIAVMSGQVEQESAWAPNATSPFAQGLAQFTPATADWISGAYPKELGAAAPFSPEWALRALVLYDRRIYDGVAGAKDECSRWAMTLAGYNGGPGWLARDRALCGNVAGCDQGRWFGHVELHTNRAAWAAKENRGYPRRILLVLQSGYTTWGAGVKCSLD